MYDKLMEIEHAVIDFEQVKVMLDLAICDIECNPTVEDLEHKAIVLRRLFLEKLENLKEALYNCYEREIS